MPRLTFIVVAFGDYYQLRTCLSSLVDQTVDDLEVIVVDNTPATDVVTRDNLDLCHMDPRIRYTNTSQQTCIRDLGLRHSYCLYTATEIGAAMATGDFLCFPNQDSYYAPVFAERMLRVAGTTGSDIVYCDFVHGVPGRPYHVTESACCVGMIDKTSFILRRSLFPGFPDKHTDYEKADGLMIEKLARAGVARRRLAECLVFHN